MKKINKSLVIFILVLLVFLIISVSYSYFTAIITGSEDASTIVLDSGVLKMDFEGGPAINAGGIGPSNNKVLTKSFTVKGSNTVHEKYGDLEYSIILNIKNNQYNSELSFDLRSTAVPLNGVVAPNKTISVSGKESGTKILGKGSFSGDIVDSIHSYEVDFYFRDSGENQSEDMSASFEAYIEIIEFNLKDIFDKPKLGDGLLTPIKFNGFTEVATTESDPAWYDYDNKMWANAKTADGSYWVWIPSFAFKINTCLFESCNGSAGEIDVKFIDHTYNYDLELKNNNLNFMYGVDGDAFSLPPVDIYTYDEMNDSYVQDQYIVMPKGFWIQKFGQTSDISVESKPNKEIFTLQNLQVDLLFPDGSDNIIKTGPPTSIEIGFANVWVESPMGESFYALILSESKYGASDVIYKNNSSLLISGCAGNTPNDLAFNGCQNAWNTSGGVKASTTNNITGVYDLSGPLYNYLVYEEFSILFSDPVTGDSWRDGKFPLSAYEINGFGNHYNTDEVHSYNFNEVVDPSTTSFRMMIAPPNWYPSSFFYLPT